MITNLLQSFEIAGIEALIIAQPEGTTVDISEALRKSWNCQRADVVGMPLQKTGTGRISARHLPKAADDQSPQQIEVSFAHPLGGTSKSVLKAQKWQDGDKSYYVLLGRGGFDAKQVENDRRIEQRLNLAVRSGGYALWDHDYQKGVTNNSAEMLDILGCKPNESAPDHYISNEHIHLDDRDKTLDEKIRRAPFGTDMFQSRYRIKTASGKYVWVEMIAGVTRDPLSGKPAKAIGMCRNIDDQMVAMERLKNSEKSFKRTQAAAKLGSFMLRVDSGVSRLSSEMAALIGMADAMVHPTLNTFISMIEPNDKEKFTEALELAKLGKHVQNLEISLKTKSGEITDFEVSIEPDLDATGKIESVFGCCQSVTERKALERRFHQAQKMEAVGQLTGGIAHDFNNLLMVVMGNLQLVEQLVKNDERALKRIRAAIEASEKGSNLTRRMLAFSRQGTLQNKETTVNDLVFAMQDMLKQALTAMVNLKVMPGQNVWPVKVDKTMLETAILNLAINARDAMQPQGGDLIIETANQPLDKEYCANHDDVNPGDYVEISVTDTGCGIPAENIEKVFQPFFTTKPPEAGSGLGLSMIYGFVKQSNGHIKIYSEVGHGTTIKIYLPRHNASVGANDVPLTDLQTQLRQELEALPLQIVQPAVAAKKSLVLVVEDNPSVRDVAAAMIEEMGFDVLTANNGHEGLKAIEERHDIDLVLSDVIMAGGMNGPELAVKAAKVRPDLKILFMSGYAPGSVRQMQDLPDTIELVNKPFTRNDLTEKVRRALAA